MESNNSIEFINFSKRYAKSSFYAVKDVNLKVESGAIFGFLGPNGAGKSTCIKSLVGLQVPTSGTVSVCGNDVFKNTETAKLQIGYVPDHYFLYENLTGRQFVHYMARFYGIDKSNELERLDYYSKMLNLDKDLDRRIDTYSHGMKQKITIIASLIHEPRVWILDEPLTGLDPESIYQVKECMRAYAKKGNIVFFSSHLIDVVEKLCTHIAIIKKGEIVYQGPLKEGMDIENKFFAQAGEGSL